MKRFFDIVFSLFGLILLLPVFVLVALLVKLGSKGPVFFKQERIGKDFRPFQILKFRTMRVETNNGPLVTSGTDKRITGVGGILRRYKLDELPQLLNVLKGEMSFVGPRPEVMKYIKAYRSDYEELLTVRPGITDLASINYSDEASLLAGIKTADIEKVYIGSILPNKINLSKEYLEKQGLLTDCKIIFYTIFQSVRPGRESTIKI